MKSFNVDLYQTIKQKLIDLKTPLGSSMFFGIAPEKTKCPFCVFHVLDDGEDSNSQLLCDIENILGESSIQISLYATNDFAIDDLLHQLNDIIKSTKQTPLYRIVSKTRQTTKNASSFTSETGMGLTRFDFTYEKL